MRTSLSGEVPHTHRICLLFAALVSATATLATSLFDVLCSLSSCPRRR